ncbi:MAG: hypothetical protein KIT84_25950 [Labilithrix sp.]|nr:hypothetical protein [Labilithrix sp.]MCW5814498.1 hypothetical protein [Labilithrix sp.]
MRRRFVFLSLTTMTLLLGVAHDARADGDPEGAKRHFEAGRKLRDDGDCAKAIPEFEKSLAADKSIGAYYNIGFCQEQLGLRQEAYEAYRLAKEAASAKKDERLKEISGALAALLETPNVRLVLPQPPPSGMQIYVDGALVPQALYQNETVVFTKAGGSHDVRVTAPGYDELQLKVETRELKGIDLKPAGSTKPATPEGPAATKWSLQHWGGVGAIGAGVVTAAIGGIILLAYKVTQDTNLRDHDAAEKKCNGGDAPSCDRARDIAIRYNTREDEMKDNIPLLVGLGVSTAVLVGGGVALFLLAKPVPVEDKTARRAPPKPTVALTPAVGPTFQGLSLAGTF